MLSVQLDRIQSDMNQQLNSILRGKPQRMPCREYRADFTVGRRVNLSFRRDNGNSLTENFFTEGGVVLNFLKHKIYGQRRAQHNSFFLKSIK